MYRKMKDAARTIQRSLRVGRKKGAFDSLIPMLVAQSKKDKEIERLQITYEECKQAKTIPQHLNPLFDESSDMIKYLTNEVNYLRGQLQKLGEELENRKADSVALQNQSLTLSSYLAASKVQIATLKKDNGTLSVEIRELKEMIQLLKIVNKETHDMFTELKDDRKTSQSDFEFSKNIELQAMRRELAQLKKQRVKDLQAAQEKTEEKEDAHRAEINKLRLENEKIVAEANEDMSRMFEALKSVSENMDTSENTSTLLTPKKQSLLHQVKQARHYRK